MSEECIDCIQQRRFMTEDLNQIKENICCVEQDIDSLCMFQELPPQLVALTMHKMQANLMSLVSITKTLEKEVIALRKKVDGV